LPDGALVLLLAPRCPILRLGEPRCRRPSSEVRVGCHASPAAPISTSVNHAVVAILSPVAGFSSNIDIQPGSKKKPRTGTAGLQGFQGVQRCSSPDDRSLLSAMSVAAKNFVAGVAGQFPQSGGRIGQEKAPTERG
jgi:hypothetical protein